MSQSRNRRMLRARDAGARAAPLARPANAFVTSNAQENHGSKSTYKIPKNVRYDLENALLGLCDVWFEDIKPHLVKNNLKLHTGGALNDNYGDLGSPASPAGDCRRGDRQDRHLDPVSTAGSGELQCLLANAARGIESAVSQAAVLMPDAAESKRTP